MSLLKLKSELRKLGSPEKAKASERFFKMAPGSYGHGDRFLGLTLPEQRKIGQRFSDLSLVDLENLLHSKEHEFRLTALLILVGQYKKGNKNIQKQIFDLYLRNTEWINNWDLVDGSAEDIVGPYLNGKTAVLKRLAKSPHLWERRIAIVSTFFYIRHGNPEPTFEIARILLRDPHDLIHKATGWMLREVGKRCGLKTEESFLKETYKDMPRTMLRYAIERFSPEKRAFYMEKNKKLV